MTDAGSQGKATLVLEVARPSPSTTPTELAALAKRYADMGADALAVRMDSEDTPEPLKDLLSVVRAVRIPVMARDWYLHPMQVCVSDALRRMYQPACWLLQVPAAANTRPCDCQLLLCVVPCC